MSTKTRDNFTQSTVNALAKRAGYVCSFPCCNKPTIGPSDESDNSSSSIGVVAHISAAAPGAKARRYNPKPNTRRKKGYFKWNLDVPKSRKSN